MAELTASGETSATLAPTLVDQPLTGDGVIDSTLTPSFVDQPLTGDGVINSTLTPSFVDQPLMGDGVINSTLTPSFVDQPLMGNGVINSTLAPSFVDKPLTGDGVINSTLTPTTDLLSALSLEGEVTATATDSIVVLSRVETRLPVADIIDGIRVLLDEVAHAISSNALTIAIVYSETVIALYIYERITGDMPAGRLLRRLLDHMAGV